MRMTRDQSVFIRASVDSLEEHLLLGSLLASSIVWFFIRNLRSCYRGDCHPDVGDLDLHACMKALDFTLND